MIHYMKNFNPIDLYISKLEELGLRPRKRGNEYYAKCPVHKGNDYDSISVKEGDDRRILVKCHSQNCSFQEITEALGLRMSDAFEQSNHKTELKLVDRYEYIDENGKLSYSVLKYVDNNGNKTFRQQNSKGEWNIRGIKRIPYNLVELIDSDTVYIVEGEKDVETLRKINVVGTTFPGGCKKKTSEVKQYKDYFKDKIVFILRDNDEVGKEHGRVVYEVISEVAKRCKIVDLPGLPKKGDVTDWLADGKSKEELEKAIIDSSKGLRVYTIGEFLDIEIPERKMLLDPVIREQDVNMIYSGGGVGKTYLMLMMAAALSQGAKCFEDRWFAPEPVHILYVDGEMPAISMQQRIYKSIEYVCRISEHKEVIMDTFHIITPDMQKYPIKSLTTPDGRQQLLEVIDDIPGIKVVFLDNLSCLCGGADENDAAAFQVIQDFELQLRTMHISSQLAHHTNKTGDQRGTIKKTDVMNTVMGLRNPEDYQQEFGCKFLLDFKKGRDIKGKDAVGFEGELDEDDQGRYVWKIRDIEISRIELITNYIKNYGYTQAKISQDLGISKATVCRLVAKAKDMGVL